jgi:hypothetical protein
MQRRQSVIVDRPPLLIATTDDKPKGEPAGENQKQMAAYADAGDFILAVRTYFDASPESYDHREFGELLNVAFENGYRNFRTQYHDEELTLQLQYASILRTSLMALAATYRATSPGMTSFSVRECKADPFAEKLQKIEALIGALWEWSRMVCRFQRVRAGSSRRYSGNR